MKRDEFTSVRDLMSLRMEKIEESVHTKFDKSDVHAIQEQSEEYI